MDKNICQQIKEEISAVKFIGYNINAGNEDFFKTNPLLGGRTDIQDLEILFSGSAPDNFDLSEMVIDGRLYSLKNVINHDLDIMYVHKPCVISEANKGENTPLLCHEVPGYPGFYFVSKPGRILNGNLDSLLTKCTLKDGFISSKAILENCEQVQLKGTQEKELATKAKILNFPGNNSDDKIDSGVQIVKVESLSQALDCGNKSHSKMEESAISGPAICIDLEGGFEFANVKLKSGEICQDTTFISILNAIKEIKLEESINTKEDSKYAPRYKSFDMVNAFPLQSWPLKCAGFFNRTRKSGWPSKDILEECQKSKCYLVCKGDPTFNKSEKMFRLSFSAPELVISRCVPAALRACYRWVKLLLKLFLSSPKLLASYHLKTMFFWYLESITPETLNDDLSTHLICFVDFFTTACIDRNIPNYFLPEIDMVRHISAEEMQVFILKLQDIKQHLPQYLHKIKTSELIKPCGNAQAINHVTQLITNSNRKRFPVECKLDSESEYWDYVFLTLHTHKFNDTEIDRLQNILEIFVDNQGHSHRKHFVDILKNLSYGEFKNEQFLWEYVLSKEINFSDQILEEISRFLKKYAKKNPEILCETLEWLNG